jgi:hypothetical protein
VSAEHDQLAAWMIRSAARSLATHAAGSSRLPFGRCVSETIAICILIVADIPRGKSADPLRKRIVRGEADASTLVVPRRPQAEHRYERRAFCDRDHVHAFGFAYVHCDDIGAIFVAQATSAVIGTA